jgi:hypothetical protein
MPDYGYLTERLAAQQIDERVEATRRRRVPGRPRRQPRQTRHALARRLHDLADRLDG